MMKRYICNFAILTFTLFAFVVSAAEGEEAQKSNNDHLLLVKKLDCKNCCQGWGSCADNAGTIGDGSCNGIGSCADNQGHISKNSCRYMGSCADNQGKIGKNSCNGIGACADNNDEIGDNQCNGIGSCADNTDLEGSTLLRSQTD